MLLSAVPGSSAPVTIAQATATGLEVTVAGSPVNSDTYRVTNDGTGEQSLGTNKPTVRLLGNQSFLQGGLLAQDAATKVTGRTGRSVACAGLAGDGGSLGAVGEGFCLRPGDNATINAGSIDLSKLTILESDPLADLAGPLDDQLTQQLRDQVFPQLQEGLQQALEQLGLNVNLDLGAVQSQCTAGPGFGRGDSQLTDAALYVEVQGQRVDLLRFPTNPGPNTKVVTNLDAVVDQISGALQEQLTTSLQGALAQLGPVAEQLFDQLNANLVTTLQEQLAPLEENVLDGTLNRQVKRSADSIEVTALDLRVLPAADAAAGFEVLHVVVGRSTCGPGGRLAPEPQPTPTPTPTPDPKPAPVVPTRIPSGLADAPDAAAPAPQHDDLLPLLLVGGLIALAGGAGVVSYRRALR
ncbi:hypothetical protein GCM10023340_07090 [Nocardioides marinquilinus]|uniref:Choice-of-anchor G family protein n=1 Tax=Nocardioides marinquilinus TaxID=1210400 RepID=A0ABP9P9F4_9ACTN